MMLKRATPLFIAMAIASPIVAAPIEDFNCQNGCPVTSQCARALWYQVSGQTQVSGTTAVISGSEAQADPVGGSIAAGVQYTVEIGVSAGLDAGFDVDEVFHFGATAEVSVSTSSTTSVSVTENCPANVTCALTATPQFLQVTGQTVPVLCGTTALNSDGSCVQAASAGCPALTDSTTKPFLVDLPISISNPLVKGDNVVVQYGVCAVGGAAGGLNGC